MLATERAKGTRGPDGASRATRRRAGGKRSCRRIAADLPCAPPPRTPILAGNGPLATSSEDPPWTQILWLAVAGAAGTLGRHGPSGLAYRIGGTGGLVTMEKVRVIRYGPPEAGDEDG